MSEVASLPSLPNPTPRLGRVLGLVRHLIDFGRSLADSLRRNTDPDEIRLRSRRFGSTDIAFMLARILRGLRRAAALHALLLRRAQRGRELKLAPTRIAMPRGPRPEPTEWFRQERPPFPLEPTDAQIAADVRRPVGAVLVDICHDLSVLPGELGAQMQRELMDAVMYYGGNAIRLLRLDEGLRRGKQYLAILRSGAPLPPELQPLPWPQPVTTGPPAA